MENKLQHRKPFQNTTIPEDWEVTTLGDTFNFMRTASYSRAQTNEEGDIGYIHYGDIHTKFNNHLDLSENNLPKISKKLLKNYDILQNGDLVIADASEDHEGVGKSVELITVGNNKSIAGLHTFLLRDNGNNFELGFRGYLTSNELIKRQFYKLAVGVKVYSLSKGVLGSVKIPLPPLSEQKAIAACLSTWDKAIELTEKLIAQKELRKKWLMQQLLTGSVRLRSPAIERSRNGGKRFCGEWKEFSLGTFFKERKEIGFENLRLLSIGQEGVYPQSESDKKDISNNNKSKYKRICPGDIGYNTMRMWQGRSALSKLEGIVSPAYTIVIPKSNADPIYFSYLFKTPKIISLFWRHSQGLVSDTLNCKFKDLSTVKTFIPEKKEQTAIAHVLQTADKEITLLKKKAEKLRQQKKGLMQVLLTGRKRLKIIKFHNACG